LASGREGGDCILKINRNHLSRNGGIAHFEKSGATCAPVAFTMAFRLPALFAEREVAEAGRLIAYGPIGLPLDPSTTHIS
jgi:hypothetical protein